MGYIDSIILVNITLICLSIGGTIISVGVNTQLVLFIPALFILVLYIIVAQLAIIGLSLTTQIPLMV